MKMRREKGRWIVTDHGMEIVFDASCYAWAYIFARRGEKVVR